MNKYRVKVMDIVEEATDTKTYIFKKPEELVWSEGTHIHIGIKGFDEVDPPIKSWVRHMSISTLPSDNCIGITTRVPGSESEFKQKLNQLNIGDEVVLFKMGSRMELRREQRPIVLLSMGVGIATFRPLIHAFIKDNQRISSLTHINVQSESTPVYYNQFQQLHHDHLSLHWANSRKEFYEMVANTIEENPHAYYYIVGSDLFLQNVIQFLKKYQIDMEDMIIDKKVFELLRYYNYPK